MISHIYTLKLCVDVDPTIMFSSHTHEQYKQIRELYETHITKL